MSPAFEFDLSSDVLFCQKLHMWNDWGCNNSPWFLGNKQVLSCLGLPYGKECLFSSGCVCVWQMGWTTCFGMFVISLQSTIQANTCINFDDWNGDKSRKLKEYIVTTALHLCSRFENKLLETNIFAKQSGSNDPPCVSEDGDEWVFQFGAFGKFLAREVLFCQGREELHAKQNGLTFLPSTWLGVNTVAFECVWKSVVKSGALSSLA